MVLDGHGVWLQLLMGLAGALVLASEASARLSARSAALAKKHTSLALSA